MPRAVPVLVMAVALGASACSPRGKSGGEGRLEAVATVSPVTNIVQNVGGDRVHVTGIVPEGTNSHTFVPAPSDARTLAEADVVFMNGMHLEEPTLELATANVARGVPIVMLGDRAVPPEEHVYDFSFPRSGGDPNPHVWTNPPYARRFAEIVRDVLVE
ncbi:MAG: zinc ABC transporter substrate-binding protein, partial [Actinobacteria bacterium]|nr:zinc ABC transporter substrate-binding protein [Actinomycetota bacterium]